MSWTSWLLNSISQLWYVVWGGRTLAAVLGVAFAVVAIGLLVASRTRWGQSKPLTKCIILSVLAHVWLIVYSLGTHEVLPQGDPHGSPRSMQVSLHTLADSPFENASEEATRPDSEEAKPWEAMVAAADLPAPPLVASKLTPLETALPLEPLEVPKLLEPTPPPVAAQTPYAATNSTPEANAESALSTANSLAESDARPATNSDSGPRDPSRIDPAQPAPSNSALPGENAASAAQFLVSSGSASQPILPPEERLPQTEAPVEYRMRQATNRLELAMPYGADHDSEAAVEAGLRFLASAQSTDGAWNAKRYGGGTETQALGEHRHSTGDRADTGVSGLALLAFLSGGHTHRDGRFQETMRAGLAFLLRSQMPSGDLSGPKQTGNAPSVLYSRMYCHGIAALAIAEAYAMTRDDELREPLLRAVAFTRSAQDSRGGGWRYRMGDPGDLSQYGWQAMTLHSAQRSGVAISPNVESGMRRFIDSCAAGRFGGLARYRPGEGAPSSTMTAEALACRLLMNFPLSAAALGEAEQALTQDLPGAGEDNVYYWYYATLALFQLQDNAWRTWNQALKAHLLKTQQPAFSSQPGSWDPDKLWGGYGGRIYSTSMSCLCLEVYYRYLPMYQRANLARTAQPGTSR